MMKLNRVKHNFAFWGFFHEIEVFPFTGDWNSPVALYDGEKFVSDLSKQKNNVILVETFGFEIPFDSFTEITSKPDFSLLDLLLASSNILIHSDEEYKIAKIAKSKFLKYGYFYNNISNSLHYYILSNKPNIITTFGVFIDPNNPF